MNTTNKTALESTKILNYADPACASIGSNLRDNVLSAAGAKRNVSVVIACNTVTLYGYLEDSYAVRAINQLKEAGGADCVAVAV